MDKERWRKMKRNVIVSLFMILCIFKAAMQLHIFWQNYRKIKSDICVHQKLKKSNQESKFNEKSLSKKLKLERNQFCIIE
jgi:hypothetical protein